MRYLPLLLLVLAGNVSAQSIWKSDFPEYLPVVINTGSCEQWFTNAEVEEVAEGELLRARLKNAPVPDYFAVYEEVVTLLINATCVDDGMAWAVYLSRMWPGTFTPVYSEPFAGIVTGRMTNKSTLLNILKDRIYMSITKFLEDNQ